MTEPASEHEGPTAPADAAVVRAVDPACGAEPAASRKEPGEPGPDLGVPVPTRTAPLLLVLLVFGALVLAFTLATVNRRQTEEFSSNLMAKRMHFTNTYWMEHGFFRTGAVPARTSASQPVYFHRSSTAGRLVGGYAVEKAYMAVTGHYGWRVLAYYNQIVVLCVATLLALLAFRSARRLDAPPLHALVCALSFQAVFITFPDNLALYWGTSGREYWLLFVAVFLLLEERSNQGRTRGLTHLQACSAFLLTYMEPVAGVGFVVAYGVSSVLLGNERGTPKRIALSCIVPALFAIALHRTQLLYAEWMFPAIPQEGNTFLFRSGLDGSTTYYNDHVDIAYRRDPLFHWQWLFLAGALAVGGTLAAAVRGRVGRTVLITLTSLLGAYLLLAAVFSQSVTIHPYLYDVMLFTPLVFALLVMAPALLECMSKHRGIFVIAVFFVAACTSMVQLRRYSLRHPSPTPETLRGVDRSAPDSVPRVAGLQGASD